MGGEVVAAAVTGVFGARNDGIGLVILVLAPPVVSRTRLRVHADGAVAHVLQCAQIAVELVVGASIVFDSKV